MPIMAELRVGLCVCIMTKINRLTRGNDCPYYEVKSGLCKAGLYIDTPFCRGSFCLYKLPQEELEKGRKVRGYYIYD